MKETDTGNYSCRLAAIPLENLATPGGRGEKMILLILLPFTN
jgi:hypothetical protein